MYYYIFDPPSGENDYELISNIKNKLTQLGIAGEMTSPSPGRAVPELIENALAKRYSTIVAVGGMALFNQVAREIEPFDLVLGLIPLTANPDLEKLIGFSTWEDGVEQLKKRRYLTLKMGKLNQDVYFLTPARLDVDSENSLTVQTPDFELTCTQGTVTITPDKSDSSQGSGLILEIEAKTAPVKRGLLRSLFATKEPEHLLTRLQIENGQLSTQKPISIQVASTELATTPVQISVAQKPIKLIVGSKRD